MLPVRICLVTELIALCLSVWVLSVFLAWSNPESEEVSSMLGCLPGLLPFFLHRFADDRLCGCHGAILILRGLYSDSCVRIVSGSFLGRSVCCFITRVDRGTTLHPNSIAEQGTLRRVRMLINAF